MLLFTITYRNDWIHINIYSIIKISKHRIYYYRRYQMSARVYIDASPKSHVGQKVLPHQDLELNCLTYIHRFLP